MKDLVRNLGNCGSLLKLARIIEGINTATEHQCSLVIVMDPLVYGKNKKVYHSVELSEAEINFNKAELFIGKDVYPWWDIDRINVIF